MEAKLKRASIMMSADYLKSIKNNQPFFMQFDFFSMEAESIFVKIIHRLTEKHEIMYLKELLIAVIREIITNAVKANTKRLYFKIMDLDINNKEDYRKGMDTFKKDVYAGKTDISDRLINTNLLVKVIFDYNTDGLVINIINNSAILEEERRKIEWRIRKAYSYNNISDAFDYVMDDSEGSGLGLIFALTLCKNAGFPPETFSIKCENNITIGTIKIPLYSNRKKHDIKVADAVIKELEKLPSFPENIAEIQKICSDPGSTVREICESIKRDPNLESSLLKLANSAGYITLRNATTLEDAVKLIGIQAINNLLIASGVEKIFNIRYKKFESIWQNSYKAAFYAQKMSIQTRQTKSAELIYLAALLSDIGQVILLSIEPNFIIKIHEVAGTKIDPHSSLVEEISLEISHSTLSSLICRKWNFNETLVHIVRYHNRPHMAPAKYKPMVYLVYLAYSLIDIENRRLRFEILDEDVLDYYNLTDKDRFDLLHRTLKSTYETQYVRM